MLESLATYTTPLIEGIGKLSKAQRIAICAGAFVLLIAGFGYVSFYPKLTEITRLEKEIEALEQKLLTAKRKARQLPKFRKMMKQAEADFKIAKRALPEKKEIPSLLTAISRAGRDAGLEFLLFQPSAEVPKEFYAEIPVSINVVGSYHNIALFFDKVARLFRVVNINNIAMGAKGGSRDLNTSCTAITYRFIEPAKQKGKK